MIHKNFRNFKFEQLTLAQPIALHEGGFYSKIASLNDEPLFIQTPICKPKQGIVNNGRKINIDLQIDIINTSFIDWLIMLEERIQQLIYLKKDSWFVDSNIELDDIKLAFNPMLKIYKTNSYLLRANIPYQSKNGIHLDNACQVYDEDECLSSIENIKENTNMISILEFQGIKFSQRIFQFNINIKQIMILKNHVFDGCQILKNKELKEEDKEDKEDKEELKEEVKEEINNFSESDDELIEVDIKEPSILIELLKEYLLKKNIKELQLLDDL